MVTETLIVDAKKKAMSAILKDIRYDEIEDFETSLSNPSVQEYISLVINEIKNVSK